MIGQGTRGGELVSQVNLDHGVMDMCVGSDDEVRYGGVRVLPAMFQDDIMRAANSIEAARAGNVKMSSAMDSKQLILNQDKTGFILFGKEARTRQARKEIALSPIFLVILLPKKRWLTNGWVICSARVGWLRVFWLQTVTGSPK